MTDQQDPSRSPGPFRTFGICTTEIKTYAWKIFLVFYAPYNGIKVDDGDSALWQFATAVGLAIHIPRIDGQTWDKGRSCRCGVTGLFSSYLNHSVSGLNSANNRPGWEYLRRSTTELQLQVP